MKSTPSVVAVVPTYNRASLLADCLRSLESQDYPQLQIAVVDDCSTEGIVDVVRCFPKARLLTQKRRAGSAAAKNRAIEESESDYLLFLDSDARYLSRESLSIMVRQAQLNAHIGEIGGELLVDAFGNSRYAFGRTLNLNDGSSLCRYSDVSQYSLNSIILCDYIPTSNCLVKREVVERVGYFDAAYPDLGHDKDYGYRVTLQGYKNFISIGGAALHIFSPTERNSGALEREYRTQSRFIIRHFGAWAGTRALLPFTMGLLQTIFSDKPPDGEDVDEIRQTRSWYRRTIIGLREETGQTERTIKFFRCLGLFMACYLSMLKSNRFPDRSVQVVGWTLSSRHKNGLS